MSHCLTTKSNADVPPVMLNSYVPAPHVLSLILIFTDDADLKLDNISLVFKFFTKNTVSWSSVTSHSNSSYF